jgi:Flp pilus assembly protein protease CpaA
MPPHILLQVPVGAFSGLLAWAWTRLMIKKRGSDPLHIGLDRLSTVWLWPFGGALASLLITWRFASLKEAAFVGAYLFVLTAIAVTDWLIRKIPNEALLALIIIRLVQILVLGRLAVLGASLTGMIAGYFFFLLPTLLKMNIGGGDVKLAAVIGFCVGFVGMVQAVVIMGLQVGVMSIILLLTHRGNLKTKIALGPFLASGMFILFFLL